MARARRGELTELLRQRIQRGLLTGALKPGDRLPGTRELAGELHADPRVVAVAYRTLEADGLVELRARSGAYVATALAESRDPSLSVAAWIADVLAQGVQRGIPVGRLGETVARALPATPLRAVVVSSTIDQVVGLERELGEHFGLDVRGYVADELGPGESLPDAVHRARLLIATEAHSERVRGIAERLGKRFVGIQLRPDLFAMEWALLRGQEVLVVVADERFGRLVQQYIDAAGAPVHPRILVADRDDLATIPVDAAVYVTEAARRVIGKTRLPVGLLPTASTIAVDCARDILAEVLRVAEVRGRS